MPISFDPSTGQLNVSGDDWDQSDPAYQAWLAYQTGGGSGAPPGGAVNAASAPRTAQNMWGEGNSAYGGYQYQQMLLQAAIAAARQAYDYARLYMEDEDMAKRYALQAGQAEMQRQISTGWTSPMNFDPTTNSQAKAAIWDARPDIRAAYAGKGMTWQQAMDHWISGGAEGAANPIEYAYKNGYLQRPTYGSGQGPAPTVDWQNMAGYAYDAQGNKSPTLERQLGEGNLGMQYLSLLASQKGPSDWIRYWNSERNAANTNLPAWASALVNGLKLPAWQGGTQAPGPQVANPTGGATNAGATQMQLPTINPNMVDPQQWKNMLPSEQAGMQGIVENQGQDWNDFQKKMQAAWPLGRATANSFFK